MNLKPNRSNISKNEHRIKLRKFFNQRTLPVIITLSVFILFIAILVIIGPSKSQTASIPASGSAGIKEEPRPVLISAPKNLNAVLDDTKNNIIITWDKPDTIQEAEITGYKLVIKDKLDVAVSPTSTSMYTGGTYTLTNITAGGYEMTVAAIYGSGTVSGNAATASYTITASQTSSNTNSQSPPSANDSQTTDNSPKTCDSDCMSDKMWTAAMPLLDSIKNQYCSNPKLSFTYGAGTSWFKDGVFVGHKNFSCNVPEATDPQTGRVIQNAYSSVYGQFSCNVDYCWQEPVAR